MPNPIHPVRSVRMPEIDALAIAYPLMSHAIHHVGPWVEVPTADMAPQVRMMIWNVMKHEGFELHEDQMQMDTLQIRWPEKWK